MSLLYKCRWLLSEDPAFGALPRLKCGPCAIHSVGFVQAGIPNGHGVAFFPSCCKFHCFYSLRGLFLPCSTCGAPSMVGVPDSIGRFSRSVPLWGPTNEALAV